jgi:hypothetical protein
MPRGFYYFFGGVILFLIAADYLGVGQWPWPHWQ